jgi:hypothetical protein
MYNNEYNHRIRKKLITINKDLINHENNLTMTEPDDHKITSRLEGMIVRNKNIKGGSGYAAATLNDLGYPDDKMVGAKGSGVSAAGMSAAGMSAAGMSAAGMSQGCGMSAAGRKKKGAGMMDTMADVAKTAVEFAPLLLGLGDEGSRKVGGQAGELSLIRYKSLRGETLPKAPANVKETPYSGPPPPSENFKGVTRENRLGSYAIGGGKPKAKARATSRPPSKRNEIVKQVMKQHNLSLPAASKYVKEKGLY